MFQQATLLPWRTSLENVLLPIEIREGTKAAAGATANAAGVALTAVAEAVSCR